MRELSLGEPPKSEMDIELDRYLHELEVDDIILPDDVHKCPFCKGEHSKRDLCSSVSVLYEGEFSKLKRQELLQRLDSLVVQAIADLLNFDTRKAELLIKILSKTGVSLKEIFENSGVDISPIYTKNFFVQIIDGIRYHYGIKKNDQYRQERYHNRKPREYIQSKVDIIKSFAKEFGYEIK